MSFRAICLLLVSPLVACASIVSSGTVTIPGTYLFDFDSGTIQGNDSETDVFWSFGGPTKDLAPVSGALITNTGSSGEAYFDGLTVDQLEALTYSTFPIYGSSLVTGDVFAVETTDGNYAKALVTGPLDSTQNSGLPIQWVTFSPDAAATAPEPGSIALGLCGLGCLALIHFKLRRRSI